MKKQTAVEWLNEAINNKLKSQLGPSFIDLFDEAKAIEKQQILEAYREGRTDQHSGMEKFHNRSSAMYYNQTYGS
jgi:hypothetical protein